MMSRNGCSFCLFNEVQYPFLSNNNNNMYITWSTDTAFIPSKGSLWLAFWTNYRPVKIYCLSTRPVGEYGVVSKWRWFLTIVKLWTIHSWNKIYTLRKIYFNIMQVTLLDTQIIKHNAPKVSKYFRFFCRFLGNSAHFRNKSR